MEIKDIQRKNWVINKLKGGWVEMLIEEMLKELGYEVYPFGIEHTLPGLVDKIKNEDSETSFFIKKMPDFVVYHPEKKLLFLIEVKFRTSGRLSYSIVKNSPYAPTYVLLVSPVGIKCETISDMINGAKINAYTINHLANRKEFDFNGDDRKTIKEFIKIVGERKF